MTTAGVTALLLAGVLTAGGALDGTLGVRLLDAPAAPRDARARQYVVATVAPGELVRRRVEVVNGTDAPMPVHLYAAAATDGPSGFDFPEGRTPNELSRWTRVSRSELVLPAGGSSEVQLQVRVPDSAAEGERVAVVWIEQGAARGAGLSLVSRVGMRLYVRVDRKPSMILPGAIAGGLVLLCAGALMLVRRRSVRTSA